MNLASEDLGTLRFALAHYARPMSLNDYRKRDWRKHVEHENEWRQAGMVLAKQAKVPHYDRIGVVAIPFGPGAQQDPGNCYPSVKAFVDGLRDARVIDDDDGDHVAYVLLLPWHRGARDGHRKTGLNIRIYEVPNG